MCTSCDIVKCLVNLYFLHTRIASVCFKVFDSDHDGLLSKTEFSQAVDVLLRIREENTPTNATKTTSSTVLEDHSLQASSATGEGGEERRAGNETQPQVIMVHSYSVKRKI